jgi:hypothetical protein
MLGDESSLAKVVTPDESVIVLIRNRQMIESEIEINFSNKLMQQGGTV